MRSLNKWHRGYLFWVGFGALEGAFLKHASTVFLDSSVAPFNLFRCAESGVIEASNLLDWLLSLGWVYLSWWSDSAEHMRKWMTNNAKRVTKAPWLVFMAMCSWEAKKERELKDESLKLIHRKTSIKEDCNACLLPKFVLEPEKIYAIYRCNLRKLYFLRSLFGA